MNKCELEENPQIKISNGIFLTLKYGTDFYLVQGGKRHHLPNFVWKNLFDKQEIIRIKTRTELESIPLGTPMSSDTRLIKSDSANPVYFYSNGIKRYIRNDYDFELAGFSWERIDDSLKQRDVDQIRSARDFVVEMTKEIAINPNIPSNFSQYPKYGVLKPLSYYGDKEIKKEGCILLPERESNEKLPVLYLIHGKGNNKEWENDEVGQIQRILGFMIERKMIPDMVIVMPYIISPDSKNDEDQVRDFRRFNKDLPHLMEHVNTKFAARISTCKEDTAIAGISIGGTTALYNGCLFKDRFNYVGGISPNFHLIKSDKMKVCDGWLEEQDFVLGTGKGGFAYITIGNKDRQYKNFAKFYSNILNNHDIDHLFGYIPEGDHDWKTFRGLFYHFMSYDFFRKKAE